MSVVITRPCKDKHTPPFEDNSCTFCALLLRLDGRYARLWGERPPAVVNHTVRHVSRIPGLPRPLPCAYLGKKTKPTCGCLTRHCDIGKGVVEHLKECQTCLSYTRYPSNGDHRAGGDVGVVLGTFGLPSLARLQILLLRETCGPIPVLIADDASGHDDEFHDLAAELPGVTFWPNPARRGHYAGDLSVFWKGLQWGQTTGLKWVCKLSQRLLWVRPGWLADAVRGVESSGLATSFQRCFDDGVNLYCRSECVLMNVPDWGRHWRLFDKPRLFNATEFYLWDLVHRFHQERFHVWGEIPPNRSSPRPGSFVWHTCNTDEDYRVIASRFGVVLDSGFTTEGWMSLPNWKKG
jgi:hypothetical protein